VFDAIVNVRGWWSEDIEGIMDRAGATFKYRFQDLHRCEVRLDELIREMAAGTRGLLPPTE
jgi:hypothetical protein